ncbi:DNA internalization-related competence protein ComEC/Rec2 [bacterium]|nr:MAG: DNA internalization-related competence protein ComEC/Rec2 [bacterium]
MRLWFPALAAACIAGSQMTPPWALGCAAVLVGAACRGRRTILFALAVALVGACADSAWRDPAARVLPTGLVTVRGIVVEPPERDDAPFALARTSFGTLDVRAHGSVQAGTLVTIRGRLRRLPQLRARGVTAQLNGRIVRREPGYGLTATVARVRVWGRERLAALPAPAAALLDGALIGERGALDNEVASAFSETGTTHVLVTAGLHLGAFAAMLLLICEALGAGRIAAALLALLGVAAFVAFSGAHLPALRAGIMAACALLARASGRAALGPEAIALAAIVVTLWQPWSVGGASFLLSFSCVCAIALFAAPIAHALERLSLPHLLREGIALTLATQIGVWPLQAIFFLQLAPYAPLANALVVPMVAPALGFGMLTMAQPFFAPLAALACGWILGVVRVISLLPYAHLVATPPPWWSIAAYDAAALWLGLRRTRCALYCMLAAAALCLWPPRPGAGTTRIVALDVGQGQAIAVLSEGHATLVDGAPAPQGPRTLVPLLVRAGIHHVDALVISHPHQDHFAGFAAVMQTLRADRLIDGGWPARGAFGALLRDAEVARAPVAHLRAGATWRSGNAEITILAPFSQPLRGTHDDVDNDSIVVRVRAGDCTALVMGDAESEEERALVEAYPAAELRADVLVLGHHGSSYSSSAPFLDAVRPRIAIASVGLHNAYGLPAPAALARVRAAGAQIFLTSRDGTITVDMEHGCSESTGSRDVPR